MAKVLYIKATPKKIEESYTLKMSEKFLEDYKKNNPSDEIKVLDLYKEDLRALNDQDVHDLFENPNADMKKYVNDFVTYDKYIIAAPFWNLSIPAILKMYIDYIVVAGKTFEFDMAQGGPVGLLKNQGKKVKLIMARGGSYSEEPYSNYEFGESWLRAILGFLGLEDFTSIILENAGMLSPEETAKNLEKKYVEIEKEAKEF